MALSMWPWAYNPDKWSLKKHPAYFPGDFGPILQGCMLDFS